MTVGLAPTLAYLVILGRDWPGFTNLLQNTGLGTPPIQVAMEGDSVTEGEEEAEEPQGELPDELTVPVSPEEGSAINPLTDFCRNQKNDPTLSWAYEQIAQVDRGVTDRRRAALWL